MEHKWFTHLIQHDLPTKLAVFPNSYTVPWTHWLSHAVEDFEMVFKNSYMQVNLMYGVLLASLNSTPTILSLDMFIPIWL